MPIARAIGVRTMCIVTGIVMIAGEAILLFMQPQSSYWAAVFPATCIGGFGGMLAYQSGMIAGLAHVDDADEGSASAALSFALQLGIGFGVAARRGGGGAADERAGARGRAGAERARGRPARRVLGVDRDRHRMIVAALVGLRHAAAAEIPLRHYVAFGKAAPSSRRSRA